MPSLQSDRFTFTSFEDTPPVFEPLHIRYMAFAREVCPTTGKGHWQGFLYLHKKATLTRIKSLVSKVWHWEIMRGDLESNIAYCSKAGTLVEHGIRPAQGQRSDISGLVTAILGGKRRADDVLSADPEQYCKYYKAIIRAEDICNSSMKREWMTTIVWIWGPTGVGKSHMVNEKAPGAYKKPLSCADLKWWDDYAGQEDVWLDDFRGQIPYSELLRLADKWPMAVSRRCRAPSPFMAKTIWITSCLEPEDVYCKQAAAESKDSINQLNRRIRERIQLTDKYVADNSQPVISTDGFIDVSE